MRTVVTKFGGTSLADAVLPVSKLGIPINIRNTNRPEGAGELNLLIGVAEEKYKDAIQAIYSSISKHGNVRVRVLE